MTNNEAVADYRQLVSDPAISRLTARIAELEADHLHIQSALHDWQLGHMGSEAALDKIARVLVAREDGSPGDEDAARRLEND